MAQITATNTAALWADIHSKHGIVITAINTVALWVDYRDKYGYI